MPDFIVKVCGVTTRADAQCALDAGANALGFNFYPASPRYISPETAAELIAGLRGNYLRVGVFACPNGTEACFQEFAAIATTASLDALQVHGSGEIAHAPLPLWRAITAGTIPASHELAEAWLLDAFTPEFGGSGQTFDWSLAARFPYRAIVAGGLDAANVAAAIRIAKPWGVDSCSRLESSPGRKNHARVEAFVQNALAAFQIKQTVNI